MSKSFWEKLAAVSFITITFVGFVAWLTKIDHTASANFQNIRELRVNENRKDASLRRDINEMNEKLSKLIGIMEVMRDRLERKK